MRQWDSIVAQDQAKELQTEENYEIVQWHNIDCADDETYLVPQYQWRQLQKCFVLSWKAKFVERTKVSTKLVNHIAYMCSTCTYTYGRNSVN